MTRRLCSIFLGSAILLLSGCGLFNKQPTSEPPVVITPPTETVEEIKPPVEVEPVQYCEPVVIEKITEASCPKPVECPRIVSAAQSKADDFAIVGRIEYVDVMSISMRKKARIDTGAETTSIDASDITEFERDGEKWVQFTIVDRSTEEVSKIKARVVRNVRIKQHGIENVRRIVVELDLRMGPLQESIEVTLADRERFDYPILIGRNFLRGKAVVDVSRKYLTLEKDIIEEAEPAPGLPPELEQEIDQETDPAAVSTLD